MYNRLDDVCVLIETETETDRRKMSTKMPRLTTLYADLGENASVRIRTKMYMYINISSNY